MIKFIFNLSKLLFISQIYKPNNDRTLNLIKRYINNCGCICIKCIQWSYRY